MNERYNFTDLFVKPVDLTKDSQVKIEQIIIPKIQRPYAQGRKNEQCSYIRNKFLTEIFESLETDEILELNFIYGVVRPLNDAYVMELLDGQQRLTTLFLIYWYVVNVECDEDDELGNFIRECLSNFTYETRATSTIFCKKLAQYKIDIAGTTPSKAIQKSKWFFKSFNRDSTITSMLTMLDDIDKFYNRIENPSLVKRLSNLQFYVKSLGVFNLSEELYIKMNARGLQLTPFENFKADLVNFINNSTYPNFDKLVPIEGGDIPFKDNFAIKLDAKWIDIFWQPGSMSFDTAYMNFFSRYLAYKYIVDSKNSISDRDMRSDSIVSLLYSDEEKRVKSNTYLGFDTYKKLLEQHPEYIENIDIVLDAFHKYHKTDIAPSYIPVWDKSFWNSYDDFYCNSSTKMTLTKLILFSATAEYFEIYQTLDKVHFSQWMRIVWNIIENTNIDSLTPATSLIRKFSALIHFIATKETENSIDLYEAVSFWPIEGNENRALLGEIEKAKRITENKDWEKIFIDAESHPYFKGMVLFFYTPGMSIDEYKHKLQYVKQMFDENGISAEYRKHHLLIRAIVCQFITWDDINERYITERVEPNKYLKNILASHTGVRNMFATILAEPDELSIKKAIENVINNAPDFTMWEGANDKGRKLASNRLHMDENIYEWIYNQEKEKKAYFRIYYYLGNITFAIPRRQYARIVLDTERDQFADALIQNYGFINDWEDQVNCYKNYNFCFGNDIWLYKDYNKFGIWIGFSNNYELKLELICPTQIKAKEIKDNTPESRIDDNDKKHVILQSGTYNSTYAQIGQRIDDIYKLIDSL